MLNTKTLAAMLFAALGMLTIAGSAQAAVSTPIIAPQAATHPKVTEVYWVWRHHHRFWVAPHHHY